MAKKYLDDVGLQYLWSKIKSLFIAKTGGTMTGPLDVQNELSANYGNLGNLTVTGDSTFVNAIRGNLRGNADTATGLQTARNILTDLSSTTAAAFDGENDVEPGVTGTLGLGHGGTGATSAAAARTNLGLGSAATYTAATSVGNNSNLPTGAAIQTYVTGLGYLANQNAFSNIKVGSTTIAADAKTDTLQLVAGSNVRITPDATNDKITIESDYPSITENSITGISIANHETGTVIGVQSSTTTASKVTLGTAFSIPNVTAVGSGSASLTMAMDTTDKKKLKITFSHTHTPPTLGTAFSVPNVTGNTSVTVPIKNLNASTFVTGAAHTITDNGHMHTIN